MDVRQSKNCLGIWLCLYEDKLDCFRTKVNRIKAEEKRNDCMFPKVFKNLTSATYDKIYVHFYLTFYCVTYFTMQKKIWWNKNVQQRMKKQWSVSSWDKRSRKRQAQPMKQTTYSISRKSFAITHYVRLDGARYYDTSGDVAILLASGIMPGNFSVRVSEDGSVLNLVVTWPNPLVDLRQTRWKWLDSNNFDRIESNQP